MIGLEDRFFALEKWLAGKIVSEMTYNVSSGTLNTTIMLQCIVLKIALMAFDCAQDRRPEHFNDILLAIYSSLARARLQF